MKLLKRDFERNGSGFVVIIPEEAEDMWHAYNLIQIGDQIRSTTIRKVTSESATGSTSSQRVHTTLTVDVETIDYDTHAGALHLKGRNIEENQHVKLGAYHTLDLELNRKFTLRKACWDAMHLERLDMACDAAQRSDVAAVVMQEGLAHVCLVSASMTLVRAKIDVAIPRKRKGNASQHDKGLTRFYDAVAAAVVRHVNFDLVKCVLVASPGFVREAFLKHLMEVAARDGHKHILDNRSRFLLVHSSSGFKHSLTEVLQDPAVTARLADTKAQAEARALDAFHETLNTEPARACYGAAHVERANAEQAVETLLVSDHLFRSKDLRERRRYVALVESVRDQNGQVLVFSSMHSTGEQLAQLSGIAAILRFPMDDPDEDDDDEAY